MAHALSVSCWWRPGLKPVTQGMSETFEGLTKKLAEVLVNSYEKL